jgi:hypothetical protein
MGINKYKGDCFYCGIFVPAGRGFYDGRVTCTEPIAVDDGLGSKWMCLPEYNLRHRTNHATSDEAYAEVVAMREAKQAEGHERVRLGLVNGLLDDYAKQANVRSLAQVIAKVTGQEIAIEDMDFTQITDVRNELLRRIERKESKKVLEEYKANNICKRCAGAGGAERWRYSGWTCYDCGGTGKFFNIS